MSFLRRQESRNRMSSKKLSLALLYGGRSGEHEVSVQSAASIAAALDPKKYDIVPVRIAKNGMWRIDASILPKGKKGSVTSGRRHFVPDPSIHHLLDEKGKKRERVDAVFSIIHGTFGEDGSLQGLFELAEVPYVGSCVLGSAVSMDKIVAKKLLAAAGIPVVPSVDFTNDRWRAEREEIVARIEDILEYPCFVKPANMGSSVGVSKAHHRKELVTAIENAFRYDILVLAERAIPKAREIECAILGGSEQMASLLGEVVSSNEFYDYAAKYVDGKSQTIIPAELPKQTTRKITEMSIRAFRALRAHGMARVDSFVSAKTGEIYLNEINALPGFTSISMYPKLWEATGIPYPVLLDTLITLARERRTAQDGLSRSYIHTDEKRKKSRA